MKTRDSAIQWLETNIFQLVEDTGGTIGNTEAHRRALHLFEGLAHQYAEQIADEAARAQDKPR